MKVQELLNEETIRDLFRKNRWPRPMGYLSAGREEVVFLMPPEGYTWKQAYFVDYYPHPFFSKSPSLRKRAKICDKMAIEIWGATDEEANRFWPC